MSLRKRLADLAAISDSERTAAFHKGHPTTSWPYPPARSGGRPIVYDPAVQHYSLGFRVGDPAFADRATAERWYAARRHAMHRVLQAVATSPWRDRLALRGSALLKAWLGAAAREPGDLDWVVIPAEEKPGSAWSTELFAGLPEAVETLPADGAGDDVEIMTADATVDDIWIYDRAPGRRMAFPWRADSLPPGTIQLDFVFNEPLPVWPDQFNVSVGDGEEIEWVWAAGKPLSLAWKLLWLSTDIHPQGKDLYDATLLAEQTHLPLDLLRTVLAPNHTVPGLSTPNTFTATTPMSWSVDWDNFRVECPWVAGTVGEWKARLTKALQPTFE